MIIISLFASQKEDFGEERLHIFINVAFLHEQRRIRCDNNSKITSLALCPMDLGLFCSHFRLPFDPVIPLLEIYPKKPKTLIWKNTSTPMFVAVLFTIAKTWKQPKCPSIDEWLKQLWDICTMEYYSATKKKKNLPFATAWMDLENIMLSEISQSERSKYHVTLLICGI